MNLIAKSHQKDRTFGLKPIIIFLTRSVSFPNGMASTQRVKLLARGLVEYGMDVSVLCTQVSERPPLIENKEAKGTYRGIHFEYTTGTTIRSNYFLIRRWNELRGILVALWRIMALKNKNQVCCIYCYTNNLVNAPSQWIFLIVAQLLRIPFVIDIREKPWILNQEIIGQRKGLSPLYGVNGVVVISRFLKRWAEQERIRIKKELTIVELPILVDVFEQRLVDYPTGIPFVLFAGSPEYDQTIQFIIEAMIIVWKSYPECNLAITGVRPEEPVSNKITKMIQEKHLEDRVEFAGYLPRNELLIRYAKASALLIPLFDDAQSRARFPTKIGEYLASGRPIVTNGVGEVPRFFVDQQNAYICKPGDAALYAQKIINVLNNPGDATRVGNAGRETAARFFHYANHIEPLASFLESITYRS